eukprot:364435-Chlamydomonas_euryale.AAC.10
MNSNGFCPPASPQGFCPGTAAVTPTFANSHEARQNHTRHIPILDQYLQPSVQAALRLRWSAVTCAPASQPQPPATGVATPPHTRCLEVQQQPHTN